MITKALLVFVSHKGTETQRDFPPFDVWLKRQQSGYNEKLKNLIWNVFQVNSDDRENDKLDMSGLQKLEWVIKTDKTTYKLGEPIGIRVFLRNISTEEVRIYQVQFFPGFYLDSMKVTMIWKDKKRDVLWTKNGFRNYHDPASIKGNPNLIRLGGGAGVLKPGDMLKVHQPFKTLNLFYDLSQTGEYELTFYTRDFLADDEHQIGEYPKPCTVRFKIEGYPNWLDNQVVWPEEEK